MITESNVLLFSGENCTMKLFRKKTAETGSDIITEKIHFRLHNLYFLVKAILFAYVFLFFWNTICSVLFGAPEFDDTERSAFLRHEYCGTFFVEINRENSFASDADYEAYLKEQIASDSTVHTHTTNIISAIGTLGIIILAIAAVSSKTPKKLKNRYLGLLLMIPLSMLATVSLDIYQPITYIIVATLILALRCGDKKTIFSNRASEYFMICGAAWLIQNIFEIARDWNFSTDHMTGYFAHPAHYIQLYRIVIYPLTAFCTGLMLRRHELDLKNADTKKNTAAIKTVCAGLATGTAVFILCRLPVRIYELIKVYTDSSYSVKLPFTVMEEPGSSKLIELPRELADSTAVYNKTILYRFIKDFPVFILSSIAIVYFIKVMLAVSKGELNTARNRRYLNISMLILLAASLWFNLMGIPELGLFNNGFTGVYGEVVFTMALRSMTEPAMYVLSLWYFKTYLQAVPETENTSEK